MNIAVILAGGVGSRFGANTPKQFLLLNGKMIIEHTISAFQNNNHIDEVAVVCHPDYIDFIKEVIEKNNFNKVKNILPGGKERYHSSLAAIKHYTNDNDNLIFHDSVRPLVDDRIIDDCIKALEKYDAIDVAIKTTDTIIQVDDNNCIISVPVRKYLRNGQTPQCFKRGTINEAYKLALEDPNFQTTDDCGVVLKYLPHKPIYVIEGEVSNMKLTMPDDIYILNCLLGNK